MKTQNYVQYDEMYCKSWLIGHALLINKKLIFIRHLHKCKKTYCTPTYVKSWGCLFVCFAGFPSFCDFSFFTQKRGDLRGTSLRSAMAYSPTEGIGISWGLSLGGLQDQHIKLDWIFQGAWKGGLRKNPFCAGGRDIF